METIPDRASVHTSITLNVVLSRTIQKRIFLITIYNQLRLGFGSPNPPTRPSGGFSSSDGGGGGETHPDPEMGGGGPVSKKFLSALRTSVCSKK